MVGKAGDGGIASGLEEGPEAGETNRVRHPDRCRAIGIVFDYQKTVLRAERDGAQGTDQRELVFYIVQGVGHEATERSEGCDRGGVWRSSSDDGLEVAERERDFCEVGFDGFDGDVIGGRLRPDLLLAVHGVDRTVGLEKGRKGQRENAASAAEIGPTGRQLGFDRCRR